MMSEIHAISALDQLDALDDIVRRRQVVADVYDEILVAHPWVARQKFRVGDQHSWVHYCIQLPDKGIRESVAQGLADLRIGTKPYYTPGLHEATWEHRFDSGYGSAEWTDLRVTTALTETVLALPMSSEFSDGQLVRASEGLAMVLAAVEAAG